MQTNNRLERKFPTVIIIAIIAVVAIIAAMAIAMYAINPNYSYGNGYYGGMMGGYGGYWMIFMVPGGLILLISIGYIIWRAIGWGTDGYGTNQYGPSAGYNQKGNALEILNQRYARGEISKEQYDQMRKDIGS